MIGLNVRRGNDWYYGSQDHYDGKESIGTVTSCDKGNWVEVQWMGGYKDIYEKGDDGKVYLVIVGMYLMLYLTICRIIENKILLEC